MTATAIDPHATFGELCDHIVAVHHERLRRDLPQLAELLDSVMRVHGPAHLWLRDLPPAFTRLRRALEEHLDCEKQTLIPACRALDDPGSAALVDEAALAAHETGRREVSDALAVLRELTDAYDVSRALCRTHRRLLESLRRLDLDLHRHIDDENDVLFPRVRALVGVRSTAGGPEVPRPMPESERDGSIHRPV